MSTTNNVLQLFAMAAITLGVNTSARNGKKLDDINRKVDEFEQNDQSKFVAEIEKTAQIKISGEDTTYVLSSNDLRAFNKPKR